ncbi:uncharacterized protein A4U43_C02F8050 [Asparagus officinalis]|uniref:AB hydrolase-1 domain-containing protein n=1 Tax=Asparagus officinalis TaxID=4686 RepID=A0A5P1FJK9_ASPOF|nr:uncharacterized protein LOC109830408 [Asparagus officinalis]ONK77577.1 uncharacterized protein A4U43_C02F8050 [Asparagus officinalis]
MLFKISVILVVVFLGLVYQFIQPPAPELCGSPNGPPLTSPRIQLRDGRHLAYMETGTPKEKANYRIIIVHAFNECKELGIFASQDLVEKLQIYFLSYDRPGYGESDPNPRRTIKTDAMDIEELADQLKIGSKFYVFGPSLGGCLLWGFLKYIPHRLEGAALIGPPINLWWPSLPANLSREAYRKKLVEDQRVLWIAHNAPSFLYWWMTQQWFASRIPVNKFPELLSRQDKEIFQKKLTMPIIAECEKKAQQQGIFESLLRDVMVIFGKWDFDPLHMSNPFPNNEGTVHLWHGSEDKMVPVQLQHYVSKALPWVRYHEYPEGGHLFLFVDGFTDIILKALLLGEEPRLIKE